jgi:hypothetical protein
MEHTGDSDAAEILESVLLPWYLLHERGLPLCVGDESSNSPCGGGTSCLARVRSDELGGRTWRYQIARLDLGAKIQYYPNRSQYSQYLKTLRYGEIVVSCAQALKYCDVLLPNIALLISALS